MSETDQTTALPLDEIAALRKEVAILNSHRFVNLHNSPIRLIGFQFLRGVAFGLGTVVGAGLMVSVVSYILAQVDFIPIIGEWAAAIAQEIDTTRR